VTAVERCASVVCGDGEVCKQGRCQCDGSRLDCDNDDDDDDDDNNNNIAAICATDDGSCEVSWSPTGQSTQPVSILLIVSAW